MHVIEPRGAGGCRLHDRRPEGDVRRAAKRPTEAGSSLVVGLATFDGRGNLVEQLTMSVNGTFSSATNQATYEIDADCTGTETDLSGVAVARLTMCTATRCSE